MDAAPGSDADRMRAMKKFAFVFALVLGAGCGGDKIDGFIGELESYKSKMCDCKDKDCAEKVFTDYKKWENDVVEKELKDIDPSKVDPAKIEKWESVEKEMKACRRKLRDGGEEKK
jgi:hypothetical protein